MIMCNLIRLNFFCGFVVLSQYDSAISNVENVDGSWSDDSDESSGSAELSFFCFDVK